MFWTRIFVLGSISIVACGCAYNDQFNNRVDRYDIAAEQARDAMVLTNIIRASHGEPLSFVALGKVNGSNTSSATVGLPSLIFGPHLIATQAATTALQNETIFGSSVAGGNGYIGNSATTSGSTNFEVSPEETKEFYRGLLTEVDAHTLELFVQQGISRELLFYIFTDRIIDERNGRRTEIRNDPLDPQFSAFQKAVYLAMDYGLASEPVPGQGPRDRKNKKAGSDSASDSETLRWQLCFDRAYMKPGLPTAGLAPICGSREVSENERSVSFIGANGEHVKLIVLPRSAFAIFQFLGRIVAAGENGLIKLYSREAIDHPPLRDEYLFTVDNGSSGSCFVSVSYEGENYCVPLANATNTKRILALLTQLIALNTSVSEIPVTPTVQILQ